MPEKNIEFLLDAFSQLDQNKFIFTLVGYGSHLDVLKDYAYNKLCLSQKVVKFLIKPSKEIITSYYSTCDSFIFASKTETQGLVLAEAMAGGCSVIALNASGSCDIIQNEVNGFLVNSKTEMTEKINFLFYNRQYHINMQKNAWHSGQAYSAQELTKKLINFYLSFI